MLLSYLQHLSLLASHAFLPTSALVTERNTPVVIWHGMGDSYDSAGMVEFAQMVADRRNVFVYNIFADKEKDSKAGFFGKVDAQVNEVCAQLANVPELQGGRIDAIGFSQGGQFLRAYVERCNDPPVRNLITFGSQHMGVSNIAACKPTDWLCWAARRVIEAGVYTPFAQSTVIQAQYYRDPTKYEEYLTSSAFLADINNERDSQENTTYARNLASLENFVMLMFEDDVTVFPKETAWFGSQRLLNDTKKGSGEEMVPMREQEIYKKDTIGLKQLDLAGKIVMDTCPGPHMNVGDCWEEIADEYIGKSAGKLKASQMKGGMQFIMQGS